MTVGARPAPLHEADMRGVHAEAFGDGQAQRIDALRMRPDRELAVLEQRQRRRGADRAVHEVWPLDAGVDRDRASAGGGASGGTGSSKALPSRTGRLIRGSLTRRSYTSRASSPRSGDQRIDEATRWATRIAWYSSSAATATKLPSRTRCAPSSRS